MEREYTKGPWTTETPCGFPYSGLYIVPVTRKDFPCHIAKIRQLREHKESEANAHLITAAPYLYETAKEFIAGWPHFLHCINWDTTFLDAEATRFMKKIPAKIATGIVKAEKGV